MKQGFFMIAKIERADSEQRKKAPKSEHKNTIYWRLYS
jgi:hypothetical protein